MAVKKQGGQRVRWVDSVLKHSGLNMLQALKLAQDRDGWRRSFMEPKTEQVKVDWLIDWYNIYKMKIRDRAQFIETYLRLNEKKNFLKIIICAQQVR